MNDLKSPSIATARGDAVPPVQTSVYMTIGIYPDFTDAIDAVARLKAQGFTAAQISLLGREQEHWQERLDHEWETFKITKAAAGGANSTTLEIADKKVGLEEEVAEAIGRGQWVIVVNTETEVAALRARTMMPNRRIVRGEAAAALEPSDAAITKISHATDLDTAQIADIFNANRAAW